MLKISSKSRFGGHLPERGLSYPSPSNALTFFRLGLKAALSGKLGEMQRNFIMNLLISVHCFDSIGIRSIFANTGILCGGFISRSVFI